jgi:hypothetical protein
MLRLLFCFYTFPFIAFYVIFGNLAHDAGLHLLVTIFGHSTVSASGFGHYIFVTMHSYTAYAILHSTCRA